MELEPDGDDEPSLGWTERGAGLSGTDDRELDTADDEDGGDAEPSLGSRDHYHSQEAWAVGDRRDREEDPAESGIADFEGLLEQVGSGGWMQTVMA
ncbi:hypothetical protein [Bradyrhizobium sp. Ai1a-2]|uniref:hypothetical protein n=1 Tax=Bradyrhizobium sp. Ai1a-2 TaxID=196490 RepID=UPI000402F900|nr:hypothetical protein [Bradyrhizobium sp. Ai1a-2]